MNHAHAKLLVLAEADRRRISLAQHHHEVECIQIPGMVLACSPSCTVGEALRLAWAAAFRWDICLRFFLGTASDGVARQAIILIFEAGL